MKVVINKCYGGFGISPKAALWLLEKGFDEPGFKTPVEEYWENERDPESILSKNKRLAAWREYIAGGMGKDPFFITVFTPDEKFVLNTCPENRAHPLLIECVEELKELANGSCSQLKVVDIPDGIDWEIDEYDGMESIHEKHESWG